MADIHVAFQTIPFGKDTDWDQAFGQLKEMGYEGLELHMSYEWFGGYHHIAPIIKKHGLTVPCKWGDDPEPFLQGKELGLEFYPFDADWSPEKSTELGAMMKEHGVTPALHPHIGSKGKGTGVVETTEGCDSFMRTHPEVYLMPDTAHLSVGGSDPAQTILMLKDRVRYMHIKDWHPRHGYGDEYWKGFCELGEGLVNLKGVIDALRIIDYSGWLTVEQDSSSDPLGSARTSRDFLRTLGV